eukprot:775398_1
MSLYCALSFMFATFWNTNGVETLYPTSDQETYHCGIDEDCTIMCNEPDTCYHTKFYVFNHIVSIQCTGLKACTGITLISANVTTLNINDTGYGSLLTSNLIMD